MTPLVTIWVVENLWLANIYDNALSHGRVTRTASPAWMTFHHLVYSWIIITNFFITGVLSSKERDLKRQMEKLHRCYMKKKEWKDSMRVVQQSMSRVSGLVPRLTLTQGSLDLVFIIYGSNICLTLSWAIFLFRPASISPCFAVWN